MRRAQHAGVGSAGSHRPHGVPVERGSGGNAVRPRDGHAGRRLGACLVVLVALVLSSLVASPTARAAMPRVAIIVGPAGIYTPYYRALADEGAAAARAAGAEVVEAITPNATWPAARAALQGASIVIYIGHGNGFPSRYSSVLNPETQDGLGLNPVAGVDDYAHRYFGEAYLAREIRLAPNAIVLLHRLCYASGNSEPGLPEGTAADSHARADNFAAGFLAAGAGAVVADAFASPGYYVRAILAQNRSIEAIWRSSPTFNGHVQTLRSARTSGATELLDPTEPNSGFYRSLVGKLGIRGTDVRTSGQGGGGASFVAPADSGPAVESLRLDGRSVAGARVDLTLRLAGGKDIESPSALGVASRWTPLELSSAMTPAASSPAPRGSAPPRPAVGASASASPRPSVTPATSGSPGPSSGPPGAGTVWSASDPHALAAEEPSAVAVATTARKDGDAFRAALTVPEQPGLYRLTIALLDPSGAAYDAATQAAIPAVLVRVAPTVGAEIHAPARSSVRARSLISLETTVINTGSTPWAPQASLSGPGIVPPSVELVGRWTSLTAATGTARAIRAWFTAPAPGASAELTLTATAPDVPGDYLLALDLVTPDQGSLTFAGALQPVVVRVSVVAPADVAR